jgi:hypothetical protein
MGNSIAETDCFLGDGAFVRKPGDDGRMIEAMRSYPVTDAGEEITPDTQKPCRVHELLKQDIHQDVGPCERCQYVIVYIRAPELSTQAPASR